MTKKKSHKTLLKDQRTLKHEWAALDEWARRTVGASLNVNAAYSVLSSEFQVFKLSFYTNMYSHSHIMYSAPKEEITSDKRRNDFLFLNRNDVFYLRFTFLFIHIFYFLGIAICCTDWAFWIENIRYSSYLMFALSYFVKVHLFLLKD